MATRPSPTALASAIASTSELHCSNSPEPRNRNVGTVSPLMRESRRVRRQRWGPALRPVRLRRRRRRAAEPEHPAAGAPHDAGLPGRPSAAPRDRTEPATPRPPQRRCRTPHRASTTRGSRTAPARSRRRSPTPRTPGPPPHPPPARAEPRTERPPHEVPERPQPDPGADPPAREHRAQARTRRPYHQAPDHEGGDRQPDEPQEPETEQHRQREGQPEDRR